MPAVWPKGFSRMNELHPDKQIRCDGQCSGCRPQAGTGLEGWRLVLLAAGTFLVPLAMALAGAILAGGNRPAQVIGASAGLAMGVTVAIAINRVLRRAAKENS